MIPPRLVPIRNPIARLSDAQMRAKLFTRALSMSLLQASGVYLIAHGSLWAGVTGFLISLNWISAARDGNDHRVPFARLAYAAGGSLGTVLALLGSQALFRLHLL
jgi:hypothetical protein